MFVLLLVSSALNGQNRNNLERKRKALLKEIRTTSKRLQQTTKNKVAAFDRFMDLEEQIQRREELIQTLNEELEYAETNIIRTSDVIAALEQDMKNLQEEYGRMARQAYRQKVQQNSLLFIFSASSLNQAFRRWQYLKQYRQSRKKTATMIVSTQNDLNQKLQQLETSKLEKEELLATEIEQQASLNQEKEDKNQLLKELKADEAQLVKALQRQQNNHQNLNNAIEKIIRKEMAANRKKERSRQALVEANAARVNKRRKNTTSKSPKSRPVPNRRPSNNNTAPSYNSSMLTSEFSSNKGLLSWPVNEGTVTKYFGKQAHPTLKRIQITNNGIDIKTHPKAPVKAVFKGEVVGLQFIPGYNQMVIIKHGNYYTVYSNLEDVTVNKGSFVQAKQTIGKVSVNAQTRKSEVHFEVWKDKTRLNPIKWVRRR